ncbi:hypothetical protein EVAR_90302_1 [Eumeta japonica]|uniref:Uncharacterized protein n=1 Tax=Eumeta variegata TaxID=151549 RepID=A0A4C1ZKY1_EUMVA|nr:hypothetical protein EVAR_90302_1 [Eumeta japonica]
MRAASSEQATSTTLLDLRGQRNNHQRMTAEDMRRSVRDQIYSFEPVESHYCRKTTNKLYLGCSLNYPRMYKLHKQWFDCDEYNDQCQSLGPFISPKRTCGVLFI